MSGFALTFHPTLLASTVWIAPIWLLGVGVLLGAMVLAILFGVLFLAKRSLAQEVVIAHQEGPLLPISITALVLVGFAVLTSTLVPFGELTNSIKRIPFIRDQVISLSIPPNTVEKEYEVFIRGDELRGFRMESNVELTVIPNNPEGAEDEGFVFQRVSPISPSQWTWNAATQRYLFGANVTKLWISNLTSADAELTISIQSGVEYPEVMLVFQTAGVVVIVYLLYFLFAGLFPKVTAIALAGSKEGASQPLYYTAMGGGIFLLLIFVWIPYNTFGEDVKMLKDSGLTLIMVLGILVALWSASVSIAEEIEGRTALTLLSKPVSRRQFIIGKFLGVIGPLFVLFVVLGVIFLITISYKVVYDARETANPDPSWLDCYAELVGTVPGLLLAFMEAVVLASISVAISTRLPMMANLIICASIYALGHLVPLLLQSSVGAFPIVSFMGQFIATVLPVLESFNIQAAIAGGRDVPIDYLGWAAVYCLLYSTFAMLLALLLFEDRDMA